ncbi:tripartite tricarboxylate transporter substrate binding protein [Bordetella sp. N]|uniref:Bug family tripartite tricarboxylate transporter substrate binding protein n=1 Tax=Bordetella sp. N TaxID=1746199 RepID=UPI0007101505|nr:tripartite tricarboxylate transporter substrate binding protein [Bordetella sp. N]ALM83547.1 LacI family transcriptional regulator [Bordetella sp. N]
MKVLQAVLALAVVGYACAAQADYPDRPLKMVVPYSAGGAADVQARLVSAKLGTLLGQQVVVENRPGASGTIGAAYVAHAPADGYTVLYDATAHAVNPAMYKALTYDTRRDFIPVSLVSLTPNLLVVPATSPAHTIQDLTQAARAKPGRVNYGSPGIGTAQYLAAELYAHGFGLKLTHVPYKGGAPALSDLMGGQIDMMFSNMAASSPLVRSGKLRALAVSARERVAGLPDVPTVAESGLAGYEMYEWNGIFLPAGTPSDIVNRLERAVHEAVNDPATKQKLSDLGAQPVGSSSSDFGAFVEREMKRSAQVLADAGIQAE